MKIQNYQLAIQGNDKITIPSNVRSVQTKKPSLMVLAGSTKGLYGATTEERKQYLIDERKSWKYEKV